VHVSSGDERVLALGTNGKVVLDSGRTDGLTQAGDIRIGRPLLRRAAAVPDDPGPAT
jgi:hypothetical protein